MKVVKMTIRISERNNQMLEKLSEISLKSKAVLIREAIDLLFKTPGGQNV